MTPIAKAFMTEVGFEAANHGVQIYGGHGFIAEWGMEQNVRDSRIRCCTKAPPVSRHSTCWAVKC
jgi:alkylation response protein AidB-like acyl-CoA dehydrogenase